MIEKEFKQMLAEFLKSNGLNQSEFAIKVGVKPSQVSEWLSGKAKPGYDILKRISISFDIDPKYLLGLIDSY